jgi:nickel-dependent lactate racemase
METVMAFGTEGLRLRLPPGPRYELVRAHSAAAIADVRATLGNALDAPIGCAPLLEMARGKKTAAISVCDITRPAPNRLTLPPVLERLHAAGMKREDISICIATGLHRLATEVELEAILGHEIAAGYSIVNHDARARESHRYLGETAHGTPVWIEKAFAEADLKITLGFIEQHLMLGFSGGRKLVAPGLAAQETIKVIHSPRWMREAQAVEGSIEDNPLHAELLEVARMARHDFMLDVTLTQARGISGVFAGEPVAAHAAGVAFVRRTSAEYVPAPVDAAITSAAGQPLDLTFYQVLKGVTAVQHIVKPGGPILVLGACTEGIGSPEFAEKLAGYLGAQAYLDSIADAPVIADQWQLEKLALVERTHPVLFYTPGIQRNRMGALGAQSFASAAEAVAALVAGLQPGARVAVVPEGPYAFARLGHA